jgi:hypothetical protein
MQKTNPGIKGLILVNNHVPLGAQEHVINVTGAKYDLHGPSSLTMPSPFCPVRGCSSFLLIRPFFSDSPNSPKSGRIIHKSTPD